MDEGGGSRETGEPTGRGERPTVPPPVSLVRQCVIPYTM